MNSIVFTTETSQQKRDAIYSYAAQYGHENVLVRIFNDAYIPLLLETGTDRFTITERNLFHYNPEKGFGYSRLLKKLGRVSRDGTFAILLSEWADCFTNSLFEEESLGSTAEHTAIVLYDARQVADIYGTDARGEYHYFLYPERKKDAILVVFSQEHTPQEQHLMDLPFDHKMAYVSSQIPKLTTKEEIGHIQQRFYELEQQFASEQEKTQLQALYRRFVHRHREVLTIVNWQDEIEWLSMRKTSETRGMSTHFIRTHLQKKEKLRAKSLWFKSALRAHYARLEELERMYPCKEISS